MIEALRRAWRSIVDLLFGRGRQPHIGKNKGLPRYRLEFFENRSPAIKASKEPNLVAVVGVRGKYKWAYLNCPCGCGELLALNLMRSHTPRWQLSVQTERSFSLQPSVHSMECGAHFWLHDGQVIWCD